MIRVSALWMPPRLPLPTRSVGVGQSNPLGSVPSMRGTSTARSWA
ncbi:Uncharacterised protein [Mycobacteroides abscessus subsp. abscessus]|nr:Uncharacterised protein [Mycobacteroides abscessus subsp. abscessus]